MYVELIANFNRIRLLPLVLKDTISGNHQKAGYLGKVGNDRFRNAVTEIFLRRICAHIYKWQYGDRFSNGFSPASVRISGIMPANVKVTDKISCNQKGNQCSGNEKKF